MTYLLVGGTGKTASRLAALLRAANIPFALTSRRGPEATLEGQAALKFEWTEESTWPNVFGNGQIKGIYLMPPQIDSPWVPMIKFVDFAKAQGVGRYVLCAGTTAAIGQDGMGRVWEHFIKLGVEYCVLRPSWFMENLVEPGPAYTIGQLNSVFTACQDGQIPFISADDIANFAFHILTGEKAHNCDYRILGPQNITYDDVAATLTKVLGRKIEHVKLDEEARVQGLVQAGVSDYYARFFAGIEVLAAQNHEKAESDDVLKVTGPPPKSFETFAEENRAVWMH